MRNDKKVAIMIASDLKLDPSNLVGPAKAWIHAHLLTLAQTHAHMDRVVLTSAMQIACLHIAYGLSTCDICLLCTYLHVCMPPCSRAGCTWSRVNR